MMCPKVGAATDSAPASHAMVMSLTVIVRVVTETSGTAASRALSPEKLGARNPFSVAQLANLTLSNLGGLGNRPGTSQESWGSLGLAAMSENL